MHYGEMDMTEDMAQYRSISALAVLTLILGIASGLALFHVMLWVLPFLAIVIGVGTLYHIHRSGESLTGRSLATTGILLGCLFGAWAISQYVATAQLVEQEAREITEAWMTLVKAGNANRLHQQNLIATDRIPDDAKVADYYKNNSDAKKNLDKFVSTEPLKTALKLGESLKWSYSAKILQAIDRGNRYVSVPIHVSGTNAGQPWESDSILSIQRSRSEKGSEWRVVAWSVPE